MGNAGFSSHASGGGSFTHQGLAAEDDGTGEGGLPGLEEDMMRARVGFLNICLAVFLFSMLPLWLWIGNRIVRLLIDKCTRFQKKPTMDECIQTIVVYWNDLEAPSTDFRIVGWFSYDHEGEMCYIHQTGAENSVYNIISTASVARNGDVVIDMDDDSSHPGGGSGGAAGTRLRGKISPTISNNSKNVNLRQQQQQQQQQLPTLQSTTTRDIKLVTSHLNSQRGTKHELERYLRTSMSLFCYAIVSIIVFFTVVTVAFWSVGTDIVTVVSLLGIAWTAVWFNSGLAGLFGNYLSYLSVLLTGRFTLGSMIQVESSMRSHGCVIAIEPLYTEVLIVEHKEGAVELNIKQIPNLTFFTVTVSSFMQGQSTASPSSSSSSFSSSRRQMLQQQQQQQQQQQHHQTAQK